MSRQQWEDVNHVEECFLVNAMEHDILAGALGDLEGAERDLPHERLAEVVLSLIDRGWIDVRRYQDWTAPDGREGYAPGDVLSRAELPALLADPATWDYTHYFPSWVDAPILTFTDAGRKAFLSE